MKRFADVELLRTDMKNFMPLNEFIELADGRQLQKVNDELYKKSCDLDEHPADDDGSRDSTPSFTVCPQKELWYCFGCGLGGDRFEYASRKWHLEHMESVVKCAEIMGFDLSPYYAELTAEERIEDQLYNENAAAKKIAHEQLLANPKALTYLLGRGMSMDIINEFEIGYAPPIDYDRVTVFNTIPNSLTLKLDRKDQFNDAILFPVCNAHGRMRYFQSRPFNPMTGMKYIGASDDHPLYDDVDRLYGFHIARKNLKSSNGTLIGVEGAPDAIACNQHGIPAVGCLGTVVNQNSMDMLDKYRVRDFVLLLDGDKAGRDRSVKIAEKYLTLKTNVRLRIASMPDGDPDEFINSNGADALKDIINDAPLAIQFLIEIKYKEINPITPSKKIEFMNEVQKYVISITDHFVKKIIIGYIADKMGFDPIEIEDHYAAQANTDDTILYVPNEEEVLLGEAMRNGDFMLELITRFKAQDWYLARHKKLFELMIDNDYRDPDSLYTLAKNKKVDNLLTKEWLDRTYANNGNVEFCLKDVQDKLLRRKVREKVAKMGSNILDLSTDANNVVDTFTTDMYNTIIKKEEHVFTAKQQVNDTMNLIHERMKNPGAIIGYSLGHNFQKLTKALLGLQTKTLTVVSANQSVGKTQICENWAMHQAVVDNIPVLWLSLEMDEVRMTFRNLCILSGLPLVNVQTGNITMEDKLTKLDPAAYKLANAPFYLSERGHDLVEALAIAKKYVMKEKVRIIYLDYIQLQYVSSATNKERHRELGIVSKAWKQFSKEMDVAVVAISQLSKQALDADVAKAEHGAGSYEIAQDADNYITLKEKTEQEIAEKGIENGNIVMNLDKNRMGAGDILTNIYSERTTQRMMEVHQTAC